MQAIVSLLDNPVDVVSLSAFGGLTKGSPAPHWLFRGVCGAWGIEPERAELNLITVSENATFVLLLDGRPEGVVRVSQPGYVGGPEAVASEIAWLAALHEGDGVRPGTREPDQATALDILETLREHHVLTSVCGRFGNILKLRPPLVFSERDVDWFMDAFTATLQELGL